MTNRLSIICSVFLMILAGCGEQIQSETSIPGSESAEPVKPAVSLFSVISQNLDDNPPKPDIEAIRQLIKDGADVNEVNKDGKTPLLLALYPQCDPETIHLLLDSGADAQRKSKYTIATSLMFAAGSCTDSNVVKRLIETGVDVNAKDKYGITALMSAASGNPNPAVVRELVLA